MVSEEEVLETEAVPPLPPRPGRGYPSASWYKVGLDHTMMRQLKEIADDVYRTRNPAIIIVSGYLNRGKTTCAIRMSEYIQRDFKDEFQVGAGIEGFIQSFKYTKEFKSKSKIKCCIFDEPAEYSSSGGNRKKIVEVNKILDTIKHHKILLFLSGPTFWELNQHIWKLGAVQGLIHIVRVHKGKYAEYAFYDANTALRIIGECRKSEKNYDMAQAMYVAYRKYLGRGNPLRGRIKSPTSNRQSIIDNNSDRAKDFLQDKAFSKVLSE